jgi:hemerythrin
MTTFEHLTWEQKYSVHDDVIDAQHQKLFAITNKLIDIHESGSNECYATIQELVDYLSQHFSAEQMVMMKSKYPAFQMHHEEHQKFIEKVELFIQNYKEKKGNLSFNMIIFLRDWIFSHTTSLDLKYGEHLFNLQKKIFNP